MSGGGTHSPSCEQQVTSYLEITHVEKKNTALIVPNAIEVRVHVCVSLEPDTVNAHKSERLS